MAPHLGKKRTTVVKNQENGQSLSGNSGIQLGPPPRTKRVKLSVVAFTIQCAKCFKWRLIPTKEKYEEIRGRLLDQHFVCETAREWRPDVTCDQPTDISQDETKIWAIDVPNISPPPPGWERLISFRSEGRTRFADVYYVAPNGVKLRSLIEIENFLHMNPNICAGVSKSQFSFQIPKPLQENYVRKRSSRVKSLSKDVDSGILQHPEPDEANTSSWMGPVNCSVLPTGENTSPWMGPINCSVLPTGGMNLMPPYFESPILHPPSPLGKKKGIRSLRKPM